MDCGLDFESHILCSFSTSACSTYLVHFNSSTTKSLYLYYTKTKYIAPYPSMCHLSVHSFQQLTLDNTTVIFLKIKHKKSEYQIHHIFIQTWFQQIGPRKRIKNALAVTIIIFDYHNIMNTIPIVN
jgi:hypothetical protein